MKRLLVIAFALALLVPAASAQEVATTHPELAEELETLKDVADDFGDSGACDTLAEKAACNAEREVIFADTEALITRIEEAPSSDHLLWDVKKHHYGVMAFLKKYFDKEGSVEAILKE